MIENKLEFKKKKYQPAATAYKLNKNIQFQYIHDKSTSKGVMISKRRGK